MAKKIFILGTQSLVSSENSTLRFGGDNEIIIPFPEGIIALQKISEVYNEKGRIARKLLDYFDRFDIKNLLSSEGIMQSNGSILKFEKRFTDISVERSLGDFTPLEKRRIQIAQGLAKETKSSIIIISKKPAFRMRAESLGIKVQNFRDDIFPPLKEQYTGRAKCTVGYGKIEAFKEQGCLKIKDILNRNQIEWYPNLFLEIVSADGSQSVLARYNGQSIVPLNFEDFHPYGVIAKKAGQYMALEALLHSPATAPIVIIKGTAGTGKTYLSLAAALQKTIDDNDEKIYSQILVTTPIETLREENLGFLPGALEQKFDPYLGGIMDNLQLLLTDKKRKKKKSKNTDETQSSSSNDSAAKENARTLIDNRTVVLQLIGHLRGRSIVNTIFIIDETQNIEPSVIKSIVTRAGEGSKFVFLGDPTQIDNPDLNERYNGLVYLSEKMKGNPLCWQVTLENSESVRSQLAFEAAKIL